MITIVYSTKKHNQKVYDSLRTSCGVSNVQVIEIINPGIMSLTEAYQKGLDMALNDIVIFTHDDVKFTTEKWGGKLRKLFETSDFGIIGLAGTTDLSTSGKWWEEKSRMVGIVKHTNGKKTWENRYSNAFPKQIIETVNVDGLFIAIHKKRIKYQFDTTIPGFHFYDIDFTFGNFVAGVKVGVTTDIRVIHGGLGETDQQWESNKLTFIEKFKDSLPASVHPEIIVNTIPSIELKVYPKVVVVIHGKEVEKINKCAYNLSQKTSYPNYKIVVCYSDYKDETLEKSDIISDIIETSIDNFSINSNKILDEYLKPDDEIVVFMGEDSIILNDVITLGVKQTIKHKNCGIITARVHNNNHTIYNNGYELWNIVQPSPKKGEQPQSSLLVNLVGNDSYYLFRNETICDVVGGTKDFLMGKSELFKQIKFNENYKKSFQDLELNLKSINLKRQNIVLGDGVIQLSENVIADPDSYEDLNKVFLPFVYSQGFDVLKKYIKNYVIPNKNDQ